MENVKLPVTTIEDMLKSSFLTGHFVSTPENLPISFIYDDRNISGIPKSWNPVLKKRRIDANLEEMVFEGTDIGTGLNIKVECLKYLDYPVIEWVAWLSNKGTAITPVIKDILVLDGAFKGLSPVLSHCNGDFCSEDSYMTMESHLNEGESLDFAPRCGRPSDGAFPYYRISFQGGGLTLAIGWPGQWKVNFKGEENGVHVMIGQQRTNMKLMPGESIRTPRMTIMSWTGDVERAVNLWRRWYLDHILPKPDGRPLKPMMACCGTDTGDEFTNATEENQIQYMDKFKKSGFDYNVWWIDAGWYPCNDEHEKKNWWRTGTWEPDYERFPNGFMPVSKQADKNGASLLLWFEPERVMLGDSRIEKEHPEWLMEIKNCDEDWTKIYRLLNLGNTECRQWLTDYICKFIQDNGVKIYRQDFNYPPLMYWQENELEDRQGMNENLYIQGYLQFWDDLLMRNPGLWIDSCASGGRRNDLETMRRSVPLHYTDYGYGNHPVKLAFQHTLYTWIPYFKEMALSWDEKKAGDDFRYESHVDSFSFYCSMAPMLFIALDIRRDDYDYVLGTKMAGIWRRVSDMLLNGDYYPLTPVQRSTEKWVARQFDIPETGKGFIQGIRHRACDEEAITIYPKVFYPDCTYSFENPETNETFDICGSALLEEGFSFKLPKRSASIWFYSVKERCQG